MRYYQDVVTDIEDLLMDFLVYRKNKKPASYKIQSEYEIGKGWPYYKDMEFLSLDEKDGEAIKATGIQQADFPEQCEVQKDDIPQQYEKTSDMGMFSVASPKTEMLNYYNEASEAKLPKDELEGTTFLLGSINSQIDIYVRKTLDEYEYKDSPMYSEHMSLSLLEKMIDRTVELCKGHNEIAKIVADKQDHSWSGYMLLRAVMEALILDELAYRRRSMRDGFDEAGWNNTPYI